MVGAPSDFVPTWLFRIVLGLVVMSLASGWLFVGLYRGGIAEYDHTLHWLLSFDHEWSIPSWASSVIMSVLALSALLIAGGTADRIGRAVWIAMAGFLAVMSMDEATLLHERSSVVLSAFGISRAAMDDALGFAWVILGAALVVAALGTLFLVRRTLPTATWVGIAIAAIVFASGALVVEVIGGRLTLATSVLDGVRNYRDVTYVAISSLEETLEFAGLLIVGWTFRNHMRRHVSIVVQPATGATITRPRPDTTPGSLPVPAE